MRRKKVSLSAAIFLMAIALLLAYLPQNALAGKPSIIRVSTFGDPTTVKIGWAKGWFDQETGIKNKWVTFDTGADTIMALTARNLDIACLGSTPTTVALSRGVNIKIIAIEMDIADNEALIVRRGINVVKDLIGKKIATPFSSTSHYALLRTLKVFNIDPSKLTILDMGSMEAASAFRAGLIDGAWVWDPAYTAMLEAGGHILMASGTVGKLGYPTWNDIVVRADFAKEYPDVVVAWVRAFLKTVDFYHKNPEEAARIVAKKVGTKYEQAYKLMKGFGFPTAEEQIGPEWLGTPGKPGKVAKGLQDTSEFLVDQKIIKKPLTYEKCVEAIDSSYIIKAMKK